MSTPRGDMPKNLNLNNALPESETLKRAVNHVTKKLKKRKLTCQIHSHKTNTYSDSTA